MPEQESLPSHIITKLTEYVGNENVLTKKTECWNYGYDNSRGHALPQAVVFAVSHEQVQRIVGLCNEFKIPLTTRGRGTGTTGATVPLYGGLVLSLEKMTQILRVDPRNRLIVAQAGVTNQAIQLAAAEHGFFWPPDPTSAAFCSIGGNLAYNSAGPRAVKYGTPRDNVLGLRAISGAGDELRTGTFTTKGVVGYDLTRLLIGSEGTLAVITEATLKLTPLPSSKRTMQAVYDDISSASQAVADIMAQPVTPCALEFIDHAALDMIRDYSTAELPEKAGALLMIEVDGPESAMDDAVKSIHHAADNDGLLSFDEAHSAEEISALWATRKALSPALRKVAPKKINEDVVVPVSHIPDLINGLDELAQQHNIKIVNFGHAGNGNIHVNLLIDPDDPQQMQAAHDCLDNVFTLVLNLEGSLSGEHGVGIEKRDFIDRELDKTALQLMQGIRLQFDPQRILNQDKTLPISPELNE